MGGVSLHNQADDVALVIRKLGDRQTVIIPDASHALFPEQPIRVTDAVIAWCLARLPISHYKR
jgi:pimeloyl-ACP methyl ester carboxylesterase